MRILHVINALHTGGAERLLLDIVSGMVSLEHKVEVVVLNPDRSSLFYDLEAQQIPIHVFNLCLKEYNPFHIVRLSKIMRRFEVVHVHLFPSQYWVAMASCFLKHPPLLITTEHNSENFRARYKILDWFDRKFYTSYDGVFCISKATEDFMRRRLIDSTKLFLVTNGITISRFSDVKASRQQLLPKVPESAILLMQVARFRAQKNQACVIRALSLLPDNYYLVFVGAGINEEPCKRLTEKLGLEDRVLFLGDRSDVPELLSVADMVIMSSHWEGFGLSAAEAMASGKIVLASDVPGLSQVVADPELRFKEDDEFELKELIIKYSNHDLRSVKEQWAKEWVARFDIKHTVVRYLNFYEQLQKRKYGK